MKTNYFGEKARKAKSSERGEAMPAAIVTAIVSSLILLGIASVVSLVVQNKADSQGNLALTTSASNIDVSLRSDINEASYISAAAKLKQPTARLLSPTDVTLSGVNMHVPISTGQCKIIRWNINGNTVSRDLTIYQSTLTNDVAVKCDETSPVIAQRTKVFAQNVNVDAPFKFNNQVGRELAFTIDPASLTKVNTQLDNQLTAQGVQRLSDTDFNALNTLMGTSSYVAGFKDPAACAMNAAKVWVDANSDGIKQDSEMVCPPAETDTVAAAWNSLRIAKVSVAFQMQSSSGETAKRDISQNSSVPLYANAAQAEASVADSSADNRPVAPTVALTTANVILGTNYTINWTPGGDCPTDMTKTYKIYENNNLVQTQTTQGYTKNYTDSTTQFLNYTVQIECARGALIVPSDMSVVATAKVIPAQPTLGINTQPAATNAALNSNLTSTATCLYGTVAHYNVRQVASTYGALGAVLDIPTVNLAINNGFSVVEGASYQYQVEAWCASAFDKSTQASAVTNPFVTVITTPPAATLLAVPANGSTNVATNVTVGWNPVTCATGTTTTYFFAKTKNGGASIAQQVIYNWTGNTSFVSNNTEGNTVGYVVQARCEGTAVTSSSSPATNLQYTTLINAPVGAPKFTAPAYNATNVATGVTATWSAVTCATGTTATYYSTKNVNAGASIAAQVIDNWTTDLSLVTSNTEGNKVGYTVAARCQGPNANSASTATDALGFTTLINAPTAPVFTSPAANATNIATNATLTASAATCAAGTTAQYYVTKNIDSGASITASVIDNWVANDLSYPTSNNEGDTVGYTVAARCAGPSANSAVTATNTIQYTTIINAPTQPSFTGPAASAMNVATNATVTWSTAVCGPGASVQYYSTKNLDKNAAITPVVIDSWTTDTSLVSANKQGYTVGYTVAARCVGANATSASTPNDTVKYTTKVNAPSAVTAGNNGWSNVTWTAPATGCAPEAPINYRIYQSKADNNPVSYYQAWTTALTDTVFSSTGGYPQWAEVQAMCNGANADSAVTVGANTTKWVKLFSIQVSTVPAWRRISIAGTCPTGTTWNDFEMYVGADGWGGARGTVGWISTDEGAHIADALDGPGGNTGWFNLAQNVNSQWNANITANTTYNWGYTGASGLGASYNSTKILATYWNASAWGNNAWYWIGACETPYMVVYDKASQWNGGSIANLGSPGTRWTPWPQRGSLKQAGVDAIQ